MNHIFTNHGEKIPCSERTLYRYIDDGILTVRNIDLIRKVKYKPRKQNEKRTTLERACLINRSYDDFLVYLSEHPDTNVVEMDTVVGPEPGKVLLTMFFRNCSLMIAFLMDNNRSDSVIQIFRFLQSAVGSDRFARLFPVILVDRGSEFSNPWALECDEYGEILSQLFYCNANAPYQKGRLEKNHEFIRYILPKGTSFDALKQADITKVMNHINSTTRASLNRQTPFKLATLFLSSKLFEVLNLELIEPDEVLLKPALLKR
jgi:Transposase and inactivated derivatives, IS30 family